MVNKTMSLYLDTSVVGGYFDEEFEQDTKLLFEKVKAGEYKAFVSTIVIGELARAPEEIRNLLNEIEHSVIKVLPEYERLADEYIKEKVVGETSRDDCIHIATATVNNIDVLVSWNFKHIVNVKRIISYNSVNMKNGYKCLEIRSPKDLGG